MTIQPNTPVPAGTDEVVEPTYENISPPADDGNPATEIENGPAAAYDPNADNRSQWMSQ